MPEEDIQLQPINGPVDAVRIEEIEPTRWILGDNSQIKYEEVNPSGDWLEYLPTDERQNRGVETWGCTNFWGLSAFEIQLEYKIRRGMLSNRAKSFLGGQNLANMSYLDENGKVNFSDKYTFIKTGTKYGVGNYIHKTPDSARNVGLIPEKMLPFGNPSTWNEFADPNQITQQMNDLADEFTEVFEIQYENIEIAGHIMEEVEQMIQKHIKQAPLSLAIAICPGYNSDDPINGCNVAPIHCVGMVARPKDNRTIYDSYPEFVKHLGNDYLLPYILKSIIIEKNNEEDMKLIKTESSPNIYLVSNDKKKKILLIDMPTLESLGETTVTKISDEEMAKYEDGGTLVWANRYIN